MLLLVVAILCLMTGATIGAITVACCAAASEADDASEAFHAGQRIREQGERLIRIGRAIEDANG